MKSAGKALLVCVGILGLWWMPLAGRWEKPRFPAALYDSIVPERFYFKLEPWDTAGYKFYFESSKAIAVTLSLQRIKDACGDDGFCIITSKEGGLVAVIIDDEPPTAEQDNLSKEEECPKN